MNISNPDNLKNLRDDNYLVKFKMITTGVVHYILCADKDSALVHCRLIPRFTVTPLWSVNEGLKEKFNNYLYWNR